MKVKISKNRKGYNEPDKKVTNLPSCFGNFSTMSAICQKCIVKTKCKKIPPPNDVDWCCNSP